MKPKIEPRLIDIDYVNRELRQLFNSVPHGKGDSVFIKYKSRFMKEQREKVDPDFPSTQSNTLSIGKKLEILCAYGDYRLVKRNVKRRTDKVAEINATIGHQK